jgi:hypothetical protein
MASDTGLQVRYSNDQRDLQIVVDGKVIVTESHETIGWAGLDALERAAHRIARALEGDEVDVG